MLFSSEGAWTTPPRCAISLVSMANHDSINPDAAEQPAVDSRLTMHGVAPRREAALDAPTKT